MNDHKRPYPWPVRKTLLLMLNLPPEATWLEYEAAWNQIVVPLLYKTNKERFNESVEEIRKNENLTFAEAWCLAKFRYPALWRVIMEAEPKGRRGRKPGSKNKVSSNPVKNSTKEVDAKKK